MPGICTSAIKQEVLETQSEFKNSLADVNVRALNPKVSTRSFVASQTMTSSSTIAMRGASAIPCTTILAQRWSSVRAQVHDQGRVLINKIGWRPSESFTSTSRLCSFHFGGGALACR